jgi:hypothetical protein
VKGKKSGTGKCITLSVNEIQVDVGKKGPGLWNIRRVVLDV